MAVLWGWFGGMAWRGVGRGTYFRGTGGREGVRREGGSVERDWGDDIFSWARLEGVSGSWEGEWGLVAVGRESCDGSVG